MIEQLIAEATECDFKVALETKKPKSWLKSVTKNWVKSALVLPNLVKPYQPV